ncbi:MAG: hypothetical protein KDD42_02450 [Bdellovibrionales bacterium]|nr:hypothetical protein [Bdellovibrionales bacterium]
MTNSTQVEMLAKETWPHLKDFPLPATAYNIRSRADAPPGKSRSGFGWSDRQEFRPARL